MKKTLIALAIAGITASGIGAPIASAAPCRAWPAAGCVGTPSNPMEPDRKGPKSHTSGKKSVNDGKTAGVRS